MVDLILPQYQVNQKKGKFEGPTTPVKPKKTGPRRSCRKKPVNMTKKDYRECTEDEVTRYLDTTEDSLKIALKEIKIKDASIPFFKNLSEQHGIVFTRDLNQVLIDNCLGEVKASEDWNGCKISIYSKDNTPLSFCCFSHCDISSFQLTAPQIDHAQFYDVIAYGAQLTDANFDHSDFIDVKFWDDKPNAFLVSNLSNSSFKNATLDNVDFYGVILTNTDFTNASLKEIDFCRVTGFESITFTGATLEDVIITDEQAIYLREQEIVFSRKIPS